MILKYKIKLKIYINSFLWNKKNKSYNPNYNQIIKK